jgi:hypothetical protein
MQMGFRFYGSRRTVLPKANPIFYGQLNVKKLAQYIDYQYICIRNNNVMEDKKCIYCDTWDAINEKDTCGFCEELMERLVDSAVVYLKTHSTDPDDYKDFEIEDFSEDVVSAKVDKDNNLKVSKRYPDYCKGTVNWIDLDDPTREVYIMTVDDNGNEVSREYFGDNPRIEKNEK